MEDSSNQETDTSTKRRRRRPAPPPVKMPSIFIAMACSGKGTPIRSDKCPPNTFPVLAGAALTSGRQPGISYDDFGQNISKYYLIYFDLTVTYWLHKNAPDFDFVGICDERRRFLITEIHQRGMALKKIDVILPSQRRKLPNINAYLYPGSENSPLEQNYKKMKDILDEKYPDMASFAKDFFQKEFLVPSNFLVARTDIFHDYADFLFSVLQPLQQKNEAEGIDMEPRSLYKIGELLTTLYFEYHQEEFQIKRVNSHMITTNHHKLKDRDRV